MSLGRDLQVLREALAELRAVPIPPPAQLERLRVLWNEHAPAARAQAAELVDKIERDRWFDETVLIHCVLAHEACRAMQARAPEPIKGFDDLLARMARALRKRGIHVGT